MSKGVIYSAAAASIFWANSALADDFSGRVAEVLSGDTICVVHDGRKDRLVLDGAVAESTDSSWGEKAKQRTKQLCLNRTVSVSLSHQSGDSTRFADIILPDQTHLSNLLVEEGLARCRHNKDTADVELVRLEESAHERKIGVWSGGEKQSVDLAAPESPAAPLVGGIEQRAVVQPLQGAAKEVAGVKPLVGGIEARVKVADPALLQEFPTRDTRPGTLAGRVQDRNTNGGPPLQGKVEREDAFSFGRLTPSQMGIMHIVQYRLDFDKQPTAQKSKVDTQPLIPQTPPPVTALHAPVRDSGDHPPVRSLNDGPPQRDTGGPPQRVELASLPGSRQTSGWTYEPGERAPDGLAPGAPKVAPGRWRFWSNPGQNSADSMVPAAQSLKRANGSKVDSSSSNQQSRNVLSANGQNSSSRGDNRNQGAASGSDGGSSDSREVAREALLWDRWYAGVNNLLCDALKSTMPAHGNPAGRALVHITVNKNRKLSSKLLSSTNDSFGSAIIEAYKSLDGNPALVFPDGTHRKVVDYNSEQVQEIPAAIGAFDSRTIQGDREEIR